MALYEDTTAVSGINARDARELAQTWTQKTPPAKAEVINTTKCMDAQGVARVVLAIDGFYGATRGPIEVRVFLQELLATYPPVEEEDED